MAHHVDEFLSQPYPRPSPLIGPWLREGSINMIFAYRGSGKTWVADALALSLTAGHTILGWRCAVAPVLYVDGEMMPADQQDRIKALRLGLGIEVGTPLYIETYADYERGFPDLSEGSKGWRLIRTAADKIGAKLVILDNISCLIRGATIENDANSWTWPSEKLLEFRKAGIATLLIHHGGKPDKKGKRADQRGTSKKEDAMDCVVALQKTGGDDYETECTWEFTKSRHFNQGAIFRFKIVTDRETGGTKLVKGGEFDEEVIEMLALQAKGMGYREIAKKTGKSKSVVARRIRARDQGRLEPAPAGERIFDHDDGKR